MHAIHKRFHGANPISHKTKKAVALTSVATSGTDVTLTAAQVASGYISLADGATGPYTVNWPSAASIVQTIPDLHVGSIIPVVFKNIDASAATITATAHITPNGSTGILQNKHALYHLLVTAIDYDAQTCTMIAFEVAINA